eukprot:GHVR01095917.1.p1 GENE.GHVR01095917.1~~GHVR01095917.1.p1  ORF type:complete len:108 (+),score=3.45 GHVR01095917.1:469-792(+)
MYLLELLSKEGKVSPTMRIVKIKNGQATVQKTQAGGMMSSTTYMVVISLKKHKFSISVGALNDKAQVKENTTMSFADSTFQSGTIAFFTNGMESVTFDEVEYKANAC